MAERGVLYRTKNGYAVVKTDLGRAASATVDMAKRSANWLAGLVPRGCSARYSLTFRLCQNLSINGVSVAASSPATRVINSSP